LIGNLKLENKTDVRWSIVASRQAGITRCKTNPIDDHSIKVRNLSLSKIRERGILRAKPALRMTVFLL
jgi:hypothetical protein